MDLRLSPQPVKQQVDLAEERLGPNYSFDIFQTRLAVRARYEVDLPFNHTKTRVNRVQRVGDLFLARHRAVLLRPINFKRQAERGQTHEVLNASVRRLIGDPKVAPPSRPVRQTGRRSSN